MSSKVDVAVGAGDLATVHRGLDDLISVLRRMTCPAVLVPGNGETTEELEAACAGWDAATVLHGSGSEVEGIRFWGLGGGVPVTPFGDWSCDLTEAEAAALLDRCDAADVLVLHSPPKGVADVTSSGQSVGSTAIRDAIERLQPRLAVCGHIHDSWGVEGRIGATRVVNLGPTPNWFEL